MSIICPTVLASSSHEFRTQMNRVAGFAQRIQIDLMDGVFAPTKSVDLGKIWLPEDIITDIHLMYLSPEEHIGALIGLKPHMVIVHAESNCDIPLFASRMREYGIETGVAVLQKTSVQEIEYILPHVQHVLIFSGDLGRFGGEVRLDLLTKAQEIKRAYPHIEIGWDGGINESNANQLAEGGVDVLNVGGAIQRASDPKAAYAIILANLNS